MPIAAHQHLLHALGHLAVLILAALPATALAGPFVEVGVGTVFGACDHGCIKDEPVGIVAVGYRIPKTGLSLEVEHRSSLVEKDYGQNLVSIRYRKEWGE